MDAAREKHNPEWFEWYDAAVFGLAVIVLCFMFVVRIVTVDGHSMEPTLLSGQRVAVQSAFYRPQYGDVVVVDSYSRYGDMLVKRVVGVGGDVIDIDFEAGVVYRNGQALDEPHVLGPTTLSYDIQFPVTVPQGSVFLLGDNRNGSKDSRSSEIGCIDERDLLGKVLWRLTPFSQMGKVT
ncbi:MAG: signal peptidase I [Ruthenibacterium sp.]